MVSFRYIAEFVTQKPLQVPLQDVLAVTRVFYRPDFHISILSELITGWLATFSVNCCCYKEEKVLAKIPFVLKNSWLRAQPPHSLRCCAERFRRFSIQFEWNYGG